MHGHAKSEPSIVAMKLANKACPCEGGGQATAGGVGGAKGRGRVGLSREERINDRARPAPDTESEKHVPRAGSWEPATGLVPVGKQQNKGV
jgi:hypothetical protein